MTYGNYAAWAAAAGDIHTVTFTNVLPAGPYSTGITVDGVLFEGKSAGLWSGYLYQTYAGYCSGTGCLIGPGTENGVLGATDGYLRSTPPSPTNAIAFDAGAFHSAGDIPVFRFSNGDIYTGPPMAAGIQFYGFVTDTPFLYVDYHISVGSSNGDFPVLDTVYYTTPEPTAFFLAGVGIIAIGLLRRRST